MNECIVRKWMHGLFGDEFKDCSEMIDCSEMNEWIVRGWTDGTRYKRSKVEAGSSLVGSIDTGKNNSYSGRGNGTRVLCDLMCRIGVGICLLQLRSTLLC